MARPMMMMMTTMIYMHAIFNSGYCSCPKDKRLLTRISWEERENVPDNSFFLFRGLFVNLVYSVQQTTDMPSIVSAYRGFVVVVRTAFVTNPLLVAHQPLWGGRIVFVPPSNSVQKKHMNHYEPRAFLYSPGVTRLWSDYRITGITQ